MQSMNLMIKNYLEEYEKQFNDLDENEDDD